jgi:hypothetical protein
MNWIAYRESDGKTGARSREDIVTRLQVELS